MAIHSRIYFARNINNLVYNFIIYLLAGEHIDEALCQAERSPTVGVTPFVEHMRKVGGGRESAKH